MTEDGLSIELLRKMIEITNGMSDEEVLTRKRLGLVIAFPTSREIQEELEKKDRANPKNQKQTQKKGSQL